MYKLVRPLLFSLDPELSHRLTMALLSAAGDSGLADRLLPARVDDPVDLMGCRFANRIGLAAGLDKDGECVRGMAALGFGFVEIGTVTPLPQDGNDKPRLFRLPEHEAIINRMGFNNAGLVAMAERVRRLRQRELTVPLGINIGKNKLTPPERAADDYLQGLAVAAELADYVTINLSSPNTPGLRDLQFGEQLDALLTALSAARAELADRQDRRLPMLVKLAPDMAGDDLLSVADRLVAHGIDGVIATNTTIDRQQVADSRHADEAGGLSGRVLFERSTEVVRNLAEHLAGELAIVAVGGVGSAEQAVEKMEAGADLVQIYSGLIYRGASLVGQSAAAVRDWRG